MIKNLILKRLILLYFRFKFKQNLHILGIESSCDDAAVSIICQEERRILCDIRSSDIKNNSRMGGINPHSAARHHREAFPRLIRDALCESRIRAYDIDVVAVTNRPGLVNSLKVGIEYAICFARTYYRPLIPIHHMRAHALIQRLLNSELNYPFAALLVSGAHCILCIVYSPVDFKIILDTQSGSPGECLDKLARELCLHHLNERDQPRYVLTLPQADISEDLDFDLIKGRYLGIIRNRLKDNINDEIGLKYGASIQYTIAEYICQHLDLSLSLISSFPEFTSLLKRYLVLAGGVASNAYIFQRISETCNYHNFTVLVPPPHLCTDNGVMIAWAGLEIFGRKENEDKIYWPNELPDFLRASHKSPIGPRIELNIKI
uniref:N(6)-L-threonylcarbamoyladenine synthase n=1 Tax=Meloidogyne hapla TaxID=6305 RepID=A0A1I8B0P9_MELHA